VELEKIRYEINRKRYLNIINFYSGIECGQLFSKIIIFILLNFLTFYIFYNFILNYYLIMTD